MAEGHASSDFDDNDQGQLPNDLREFGVSVIVRCGFGLLIGNGVDVLHTVRVMVFCSS